MTTFQLEGSPHVRALESIPGEGEWRDGWKDDRTQPETQRLKKCECHLRGCGDIPAGGLDLTPIGKQFGKAVA